ncbi:hypothetical protein CVS40_12768 [Lucilia cuprina]|nr:hypothetical protein CVS40_12768 [Lucilia cuprina]
MFDPEGFGEITVDEFINALKSPEFISQVPMNKRELLLERAKKAKLPIGPGYITFQDFVNVDCRSRESFLELIFSVKFFASNMRLLLSE